MAKKWKLREADAPQANAVSELTGLPLALARLLVMRGLTAAPAVQGFLQPKLAHMLDPFLLPDMACAVDRVWAAIDAKQTICIFGDYDVDGVTSSSLLVRVLRELGAEVVPFIPDRLDEGYGLSADALERCLDEFVLRKLRAVVVADKHVFILLGVGCQPDDL